MEVLGYSLAVLMGTVLGLIGGGGSILTVPILVYVFSLSAVESTAYSLFIVGLSAMVGAVQHFRSGNINVKIGVIFAAPAFVGVYMARRYIVSSLPDTMIPGTIFEINKGTLILLVFAVVMLAAAISMIRGRKNSNSTDKKLNFPLIIVEGLFVGVITGFVGAGGGFLLIPALVVLTGLEMKIAVGTSLMIIAAKSLLGFVGDVQVMEKIDWNFLVVFSLFSIIGIFCGIQLSKRISGATLKPAFGWFVLTMGSLIIFKELFFRI